MPWAGSGTLARPGRVGGAPNRPVAEAFGVERDRIAGAVGREIALKSRLRLSQELTGSTA